MIVRSIRVEGWRCFADSIEVGEFGHGLNVVHGPNGIGKSTLFMALVRGVFDGHKVAGEAMKSLRPWGRDLGPTVTLELSCGNNSYRLRKQFLTSPKAELFRQENGKYVRLAEGVAADERARELLCGDSPGRGASDRRHWGLAQVLWAPQGELTLGQLSSVTKQTIQQALGAQVTGEETTAVEQKVSEHFARYFTPTGKLRTGGDASPLPALTEQLSQAKERRDRLRVKLAAFDDAVHSIESFRLVTSQSRQKLVGLEAQLVKAQQRADEYIAILAEKQQQTHEATATKARFDELNARLETIRSAIDDASKLEATIASLQDQAAAVAREVQLQTVEADRAHAAVEKVRLERDSVRLAARRASDAARFVDVARQLAALNERLEQIGQAQAKLDALRQRRAAVVAPDAKTLTLMLRAIKERDDARVKLDASLITVTWQSEGSWPLETLRADQARNELIDGDAELQLRGSPEVAFRIPGVGTFRASGPAGSVDTLRSAWEDSAAKADKLLSAHGGQSVEQLQQNSALASELDQQAEKLQARVDAVLNRRTFDELRLEQAQLQAQRSELVGQFPEWEMTAPNAPALRSEAERIDHEFVQRIDAAENDRKQAVAAVGSAAEKVARHEENLKNARQQLQAAKQRLAIARDDGRSDEQRRDLLDDFAIQWRAAKVLLGQIDEKLNQLGSDPRDEVKVLQRQLQGLRTETAATTDKMQFEQGKLQSIVAEAPYSALAMEEEAIADLEQRISREQLQADAIKLLHDTLCRRKRELIESLVGPVRQRAMQTLARITGSRFERLEISDSFDLSGIVPRTSAEAISLDQLSGGEREQAYFAVRMALADIAMQGERQLVVLDDVFTFTDTARLARIVQVLEEAAERFQIVMLTCHPERYRGLPGAKFFDLEEIVARHQEPVTPVKTPSAPIGPPHIKVKPESKPADAMLFESQAE
jgi:DNA repair exonuclease SbcCD ATPase subunit